MQFNTTATQKWNEKYNKGKKIQQIKKYLQAFIYRFYRFEKIVQIPWSGSCYKFIKFLREIAN